MSERSPTRGEDAWRIVEGALNVSTPFWQAVVDQNHKKIRRNDRSLRIEIYEKLRKGFPDKSVLTLRPFVDESMDIRHHLRLIRLGEKEFEEKMRLAARFARTLHSLNNEFYRLTTNDNSLDREYLGQRNYAYVIAGMIYNQQLFAGPKKDGREVNDVKENFRRIHATASLGVMSRRVVKTLVEDFPHMYYALKSNLDAINSCVARKSPFVYCALWQVTISWCHATGSLPTLTRSYRSGSGTLFQEFIGMIFSEPPVGDNIVRNVVDAYKYQNRHRILQKGS